MVIKIIFVMLWIIINLVAGLPKESPLFWAIQVVFTILYIYISYIISQNNIS